jgi:thiosulfate reductase cytochrome b subunit
MTREKVTHPGWMRVSHWINVVAFTLMIMSGWRIYNASPIFGTWEFPRALTLGGWLGGALLWHFAAMWVLMANGAFYLVMGVVTGRFRRQLFPLTLDGLRRDAIAAVRGELSHEDIERFNAIQKLAYIVAITALVLIVLSGLVVFKSVQFPLLRELLGGYDSARVIHFACMAILFSFLLVHVAAAAFVPKTILAMIRGH